METTPQDATVQHNLEETSYLDKKFEDFTDDEIDQVADVAIATLQEILRYFDLGEVSIEEFFGDEQELILDITGENLAILIGRHGKTLDALQTLVSSIVVRKLGYRYPLIIDIEGYKGKQRVKLENMALSAAERAKTQQRCISMRPMSAYERRLVHITLREDEAVETMSEGTGSSRHVVICPVK